MLRTWRGPLLGMALALLVAGCATSTHPVPHSTTTKRGSTPTNITTAISKWQVVLKNDQVVYTSLTCPTTERCIAGGFGPIIDLSYPPGDPIPMPTPEFGVISNTQDGGKHWTTIRMARPVAAVACMSKVRCIAVEQGNLYNPDSGWSTWVSIDGGNTWTKEPSPGPGGVTSLTCPSVSHCVAMGVVDVHAVGQIPFHSIDLAWVSNDGGISWVKGSLPNLDRYEAFVPVNAISCPTPSWCMTIGFVNGVLITQNGGATWQVGQSSGMPINVAGLSTVSCVVVDPVLYECICSIS